MTECPASARRFADQVRESEVRHQLREPTSPSRAQDHRLDPRRGELVEHPAEVVAAGGELPVAVDHHHVESPRRVTEQPAQARSLRRMAEGLVGVGGDVAPVGALGHLAGEAANLAVQAGPAAAAGGVPGVDRGSPQLGLTTRSGHGSMRPPGPPESKVSTPCSNGGPDSAAEEDAPAGALFDPLAGGRRAGSGWRQEIVEAFEALDAAFGHATGEDGIAGLEALYE